MGSVAETQRGGELELSEQTEAKPIGSEFWSLLDYCSQEGRICPDQGAWRRLWQMLPEPKEIVWPSKQLAASAIERGDATDNALKWLFVDHLVWAHRKGVFAEIDRYLRSLGSEHWLVRR